MRDGGSSTGTSAKSHSQGGSSVAQEGELFENRLPRPAGGSRDLFLGHLVQVVKDRDLLDPIIESVQEAHHHVAVFNCFTLGSLVYQRARLIGETDFRLSTAARQAIKTAAIRDSVQPQHLGFRLAKRIPVPPQPNKHILQGILRGSAVPKDALTAP